MVNASEYGLHDCGCEHLSEPHARAHEDEGGHEREDEGGGHEHEDAGAARAHENEGGHEREGDHDHDHADDGEQISSDFYAMTND